MIRTASLSIASFLLLLLASCLGGCVGFGSENSVQAQMNAMADRLQPIILKAVEQIETSNIAAQGGVHAISPGYRGKISGSFGPAFVGEFDIELKNVAGQLTWNVAGQGEKERPAVVPIGIGPPSPAAVDPLANVRATIELLRELRALDAPAAPPPAATSRPATQPSPS